MTAVDLIIFDLDGTLIDSRKDIAHCVNWTLRDMELPEINHDVIYSHVGHGVRDLMQGAIQEAHGEEAERVYDKALALFDHYYSRHLLDHTRLFGGMDEVLVAFREKSMAVITNKPQKYTDPIMAGLAINGYFGAILGREAAQESKPHPAPIFKVMEQMPANKERTVVIGDTEVDIEAGKRAGVLTCGVLFGFGKPEEVRQAKPDFIVEDTRELLQILQ